MGISVVLSLYSMYPKKFLYFLCEIKFSRKSVFSAVFRNKESFPRRNGIAKIREIAKRCEKDIAAQYHEYIMSEITETTERILLVQYQKSAKSVFVMKISVLSVLSV